MDDSELISMVGQKALDLFQTGGLCCSEAVLECLNNAFRGEISEDLVPGLASGLRGGIANGTSVCGALSGAVVALGSFLGPGRPYGLSKKKMRRVARELYAGFEMQFGDTVCNDLTRPFARDRKGLRKNCAQLTSEAARISAILLLRYAPEIASQVDYVYLRERGSRMSALARKIRLFAG